MGDVVIPGRSEADLFRVQSADMAHQDEHRRDAPWTGHPPMAQSHARRVGVMGQSAQCQECGTICMANFELGAFVGPPGDPLAHMFPWRMAAPQPAEPTGTAATVLPAPTFGSDRKPRPAGIPAGAPRNLKKSRELRRLQQQRARAKERGEPITPDMFTSTKAYVRWRRRYGRDGVIVAELPEKPPKVQRPRFTSLRRASRKAKPEEPPYAETVPDWDDPELTEIDDALAEAEANLARLRALPELDLPEE